MRKGVAIPYMVGLLIAIIVLAVATYLIFLYVIQKKPFSCAECGAKFSAWCSNCFLKGWEGSNTIVGTDLEECVKDCGYYTPSNNDCSAAEEACKGVGVPP